LREFPMSQKYANSKLEQKVIAAYHSIISYSSQPVLVCIDAPASIE
jgi:hypothetical protein